MWLTLFNILKKLMPIILKWGPIVFELVRSGKYEDAIKAIISKLSSRRPDIRLRGKIDMAVLVVQEVVNDAQDVEEKERATGWLRRLNRLSHQMQMPIRDRAAAKDRRSLVARRLDEISSEMAEFLGSNASTAGAR